MARPLSVLSCALCLFVGSAYGQKPPAAKEAKVEFRRLSDKPIKGVTEEKGFQTTCGPELSYAYLKPVLANADVAGVKLTTGDYTANGLTILHMIDFQITEAARRKLVTEAGDLASIEIATYIDGTYWGTTYFRKAEPEKFAPSAGFFSSREDVDRIIATFSKK